MNRAGGGRGPRQTPLHWGGGAVPVFSGRVGGFAANPPAIPGRAGGIESWWRFPAAGQPLTLRCISDGGKDHRDEDDRRDRDEPDVLDDRDLDPVKVKGDSVPRTPAGP